MLPLYSAKLLKAWDQVTMLNQQISSIELMERAAASFTNWFTNYFSDRHSVLLFCGNGNNGGDGLAIARLLKRKQYRVQIVLLKISARNTFEYEVNLDQLKSLQSELLYEFPDIKQYMTNTDNLLIIDAIFGYGLNRSPEQGVLDCFNSINASGCPVISIDIPSGMYVDSRPEKTFVHASYTFTFQVPKLCQLIPDTGRFCGRLLIGNIDLDRDFPKINNSDQCLLEDEDLKAVYKPRNPFDHKNKFGHLLIIGGNQSMSGALLLTAKASLRSGCGLCTLSSLESNSDLVHLALPECIFQPLQKIDFSNYTSIVIGPGMGKSAPYKEILREVLLLNNKPMVIDADALNIIAEEKWDHLLSSNCVITPHVGEFDRLFGPSIDGFERLNKARNACAEFGIHMILKGKYSAIIHPDRKVYFNHTGNPGLAKAGSGDVLSGIIGSLLSQAYPIPDACLLGAGIHGMAADIAKEKLAEESIIASDVIAQISNAFIKIRS